MYYLGIDGGGTKTAFVLINNKGNILAEIEKGTCHHMQVGLEGFERVIKEGLKDILNIASICSTDIK